MSDTREFAVACAFLVWATTSTVFVVVFTHFARKVGVTILGKAIIAGIIPGVLMYIWMIS